MCLKILMNRFTGKYLNNGGNMERIKQVIENADTIVIGAGAGLSTAAGFTYSGERFDKYFKDFKDKYHFTNMYAGGFYPYETFEEYWAFWSRYIYINRYMDAPKKTYEQLFEMVKDKDYFVLTSNVDHCFQKAGFDKKRIFYTQGDYGLFQCSKPCCNETYDNEKIVTDMVKAQGYTISDDGSLKIEGIPKMSVPTKLIPICPHCGKPMSMNLRADDTFVEDEGWHAAAERYDNFIRTRASHKIVFLELGVGYNTPVIIKYPFWRMTQNNPDATYICINYGEAAAPSEIKKQSICADVDINELFK